MCPREGKECNEYMCGQSIDGICGGKPKESDYDRGYKKGRADVINELMKTMESWSNNIMEIRGTAPFFTLDNIRDITEQLKEKEE